MGPHYLALHKKEWDRINRRYDKVDVTQSKEDYLNSLNELSQSWKKTWPDTVEGHVHGLQLEKKSKRSRDLEFINNFKSLKKLGNEDVIKAAKKQIFEESCYGRQLLSALLESKTLVERELQIKFNKKIQEEQYLKQVKPISTSIESAAEMERKEKASIYQQRKTNVNIAHFNKATFQNQSDQRKKVRTQEYKVENEEAVKNKLLIYLEDKAEKDSRLAARREMLEHDVEAKKIKEEKKQRDIEVDNKIAIWKNYNDRIACKIKAVNKKLTERCETEQYKIVFNLVAKSKLDEKNHYEKFVNEGIRRHKNANLIDENLKQIVKTCSNETKMKYEQNSGKPYKYGKCVCDRQCIMCKSNKEKKCLENQEHNIKKSKDMPPSQFLTRSSKLVEAYRRRKEEPSPWNGMNGAHHQFSQYAKEILQECRYKHFPQKVIDEYNSLSFTNTKQ